MSDYHLSLNLNDNPTLNNIYEQIQVGIQKYLTEAVVSASTSISNIISFIFTLVLSPIILFYMLKDHNEISEGIYNIIPIKYKIHFAELVKRANETLGLYIRGQIILMVGIAVISTLGYTLIGLDNAILFGIIVGLTNIIPYIGATLAAVVPVTYSLLTGDVPWYYIILLNIGFQFIEGNILQPIIMSKQLDIHPLIILVAILGFGSLFGVLGIIFAVPLAGLIKVCILYINEIREKNELVEDEL
jgi:putative permease